jgi:DNA-directed RNA polymerase subunit alpha
MRTEITPLNVRRIKELAHWNGAQEIARSVGLSRSAVYKVRHGDYDGQPRRRRVVWCNTCRCHVYPPCQMCRIREHKDSQTPRPSVRVEVCDPVLARRLHLSLAEIGLPVRAVNCLENHGIFSVSDLLQCTAENLAHFKQIGVRTLRQIYRCLARLGFKRRSRTKRAR